MKKPPTRLINDPIVEAVIEVRFSPTIPSVADLLPGIFFTEFTNIFARSERLVVSEIPFELRDSDPNLRYTVRHRLAGDSYALLLGDRALTCTCLRPYAGWRHFRPVLEMVIGKLRETKLVDSIERCSAKYVNVLPAARLEEQYKYVRFEGALGNFSLTQFATKLRSEIVIDDWINIVELAPSIRVDTPRGDSITGLLLSIDSIKKIGNEFWEDPLRIIDEAHDREKAIFFDLLTEHALKAFEPEWSDS